MDRSPFKYWSLLRTELLWIFDGPLSIRSREMPYFPAPTAAWLIRKGSLTLRFQSGEEHYEAGQWVFPKNAPGQQIFTPGAHLLSVRFHAEWPNAEALFSRAETVSLAEAEAPELTAAASELIRQLVAHCDSYRPGSTSLTAGLEEYLAVQPAFAAWVLAYYRAFTASAQKLHPMEMSDGRILAGLSYLEGRSLSTPFVESELVGRMGLSLSQINRLFKKRVGATARALWLRRRLMQAQLRLAHTVEPVKTMAYELGFSSPSHFSRWFAEHAGVSPKRFRSTYRESV